MRKISNEGNLAFLLNFEPVTELFFLLGSWSGFSKFANRQRFLFFAS